MNFDSKRKLTANDFSLFNAEYKLQYYNDTGWELKTPLVYSNNDFVDIWVQEEEEHKILITDLNCGIRWFKYYSKNKKVDDTIVSLFKATSKRFLCDFNIQKADVRTYIIDDPNYIKRALFHGVHRVAQASSWPSFHDKAFIV